MIDLANHNAEVSLNNKFELIARDESRTVKAIEELGERMGIQTPIRIEASDNSNIQGVDPVSAMVTFVDGKPDKKDIVNIKLKQSKVLTTINQCEKLFDVDIHVY